MMFHLSLRTSCHLQKGSTYNGGVDAAARSHERIAGPSLMRNTLPPLASNDLFDIAFSKNTVTLNRPCRQSRAKLCEPSTNTFPKRAATQQIYQKHVSEKPRFPNQVPQ